MSGVLSLLRVVALGSLLLLAPGCSERVDRDPRLNVLLVTADDLGLQLGSYGETRIATPSLDRLAASGVRFETVWVAQASCSPSRSALLTGLHPHATGQLGLVGGGFRHRPRIARQALPNLLHEAGYRTGIIGKLHVAPADQIRFDHRHLDRRATRFVRGVAEEARAFFEERPEQPFFLMVNYSDPHASRSGTDPVRWSFESRVDGVPAEPAAPGPDMVFPFQGIDTPEQRARVAGFYAGVQRLDVGVGLLLDALDAAGRTDDTLVIFVSDHGPPFDRAKTTVYEAGLRVPLLVRWPGVTRPQVSDALVSTLDLAPTVLDATSTPLPSRLHGHTLRPLLEDPDAGWRPHLFAGFNFHGANRFVPRRAIRDHRYKLIHNLLAGRVLPETGIDGDGAWEASQRPELAGTAVARAFATFADPPEWELYDLAADPWEFVDLAGRPELADVEAGLRAALLAERRRTRDPFLDSEQLERMRDRPPWRHAPEDEWD